MSIQRYGNPSHDYMTPAHADGFLVLYADHVAAVAAAEQRGREKCHDWRLHTAELERLLNAEGAAAHAAGVAQGVKAAREAVAALMPDTADEGVVLEALAAIDALRETA